MRQKMRNRKTLPLIRTVDTWNYRGRAVVLPYIKDNSAVPSSAA